MKHTFLKHAWWLALLVAGGALAQDAAIRGADFTHGKADALLAAVGGKAAINGQTVVVTAPTYWQAKVAAKIRAGAHGKPVAIRFSNGFYENVLVRTEAAAPVEAAAKPAPKPVAKPAVKPEPRLVKAAPEPAAKPVPPAPPHVASPLSAPVQKPMSTPAPVAPQVASNIVTVPQVSQRPAVVPIPTAAINPAEVKPVSPASPAHDEAAARRRMLASLNDERPASGSLTEAQLQSGDQVYSDGDTLAVVRLEGLHRDLYWLQGAVDLQRVQFMPQGNGRYQVTGPIDPKAPVAHRSDANAHHVVAFSIPAPGSAARARLEQRYNNGQPITGDLAVTRLQPEDRLLVDGSSIIIARREGNSMARYWLDGSIDLGQTGIQKVDGNVYRVVGNDLH